MRTFLFVALSILSVATLAAGECCNGWDYLRLPSAKKALAAWDYFVEIEHKGGPNRGSSSVCASRSDLVRRFPIRDRTGLYWDYVSQFQRGRSTEIYNLGSVHGTRITEIVHRFSEPIDYIKILTFSSKESDLLCPFLTIAEWNRSLQYSKSAIVDRDGTKIIATSMVDHIAARGPEPMNVDFRLEHGLPKFSSTP